MAFGPPFSILPSSCKGYTVTHNPRPALLAGGTTRTVLDSFRSALGSALDTYRNLEENGGSCLRFAVILTIIPVVTSMNDSSLFAEFEASGLTKTLWVKQVCDSEFPEWNDDFNSVINALYFAGSTSQKAWFAYRLAAGYVNRSEIATTDDSSEDEDDLNGFWDEKHDN